MKNYVIDTNVLIQAPNALWAFQENRIVIPLVVVEELDHLKKAEGEKGANARKVIRCLEQLRHQGDLLKGSESDRKEFFGSKKTLYMWNCRRNFRMTEQTIVFFRCVLGCVRKKKIR